MTFSFWTFEKMVFCESACAVKSVRGAQSMYYHFLRHFDYLKILFVVCAHVRARKRSTVHSYFPFLSYSNPHQVP